MKKTIQLLCALLLLASISKAQNTITWNPETDLATSASGNNHPRMVLGSSGQPLVVWNHANRCMFSRWNGAAFTNPVLLNPVAINVAGADWMGPDIAAHGDTVYVVFKQTPEASSDSHIFCVHSYDGGTTFSVPVRVDNIADSLSRFPTVTTDDLGNPIIGFMKFDAFFDQSRWAVCRSTDFGLSFSSDVKASGWSDPDAVICDCCPGAISCTGAAVAMVYRDNNANIRDIWAGVSTDTASTFPGGMGIDQQNWFISACPATGPDAVIVGDTLYSTFMNGVSGSNLVYFSKSAISDMSGSMAIPITGSIPGLALQNFPRIASDGKAMAIAWMQVVNNSRQGMLRFTNDLLASFPAAIDTITLGNIYNCDVAISDGKIYVVWQNNSSGTIKYRTGTYSATSGLHENNLIPSLSVFPNPSTGDVHIESDQVIDKITVVNMFGQVVHGAVPNATNLSFELNRAGIYSVMVKTEAGTAVRKLVVALED